MRLIFIFLVLISFYSCSFDNKTGIWSNENDISAIDKELDKYKDLISSNESFNQIIDIDPQFKFNLKDQKINFEWLDIFYNKENNQGNFKYQNLNKLIYKSKKITKNVVSQNFLYENGNIITSDEKGNLIIFSIKENKILNKFNFYKNRYKGFKKKLNIIVENNIIYISDNIGFLYSYDYKKEKIKWAKNYKIPFRSNLKILDKRIVASNQNNTLYFFNKDNGEIIKFIPTEETVLQNRFISNLARNDKNLFFLNTYGSLYSIDLSNMSLNWFININQSLDLSPSNLFVGNTIIIHKDRLIITSNQFLYVLNATSGSIIYKQNYSSLISPVAVDDYLFIVSKNNLIIASNLKTGEVIFSYDINEKIANHLNQKKKTVYFKKLTVADNKIILFLKNSYLLEFKINGNLNNIKKLPSKINSNPIFIDGKILYIDKKNKLLIIN